MIGALTLFALFTLVGCESQKQHPDEKDAVNSALTSANLGVVSVSQDRDKGVMTLTGDVESGDKKQQAEAVTKQTAPDYTISNQLEIVVSTGHQLHWFEDGERLVVYNTPSAPSVLGTVVREFKFSRQDALTLASSTFKPSPRSCCRSHHRTGRQLLRPMRGIVGGIQINRHPISPVPQSLAVTPHYADRQGFTHPIKFFNSYPIFETRQRRLGGQVATFYRIPIQ
jgi:hypothetical protein